MLQEYTGRRCISYCINPQRGGCVETVADVYASDFFRERGGSIASPRTPSTPTGSIPTRRVWRRLEAALERIFLPEGYPNSVTEDLLMFALWDLAQVLANNVTATLSVRSVLLGVGVGESKANLTSSTLSWMMRDGTRMIGSVVFASLISQNLEHRSKTWRLVADFTNDMAYLLELCAPWLPGGQLTFRAVVVAASVIKALAGVCGHGTCASFTQHFALRNNAADVSAKSSTRCNFGSLIGLALGMAIAYIVPATSTTLNLAVFTLCTVLHIFANYRGVRGVQLKHLNAPRLEWCLEQYCAFRCKVLISTKKESGARSVMPTLDVSPQCANAAERLLILPALRAVPSSNKGLHKSLYRFLRRYCLPATLTVCMHGGESLSRVLQLQNDLTTRRKQELLQHIEASLASRGVALLVDSVHMAYYTILPEYFTVEGVPESWVRYKRQYEAGLKHVKAKHRYSEAPRDMERNLDEESRRTAQAEAEAQEAEDLERLRKERVAVPQHILSLAYRQLWAYFYAFMHCRAERLRRERLLTHANGFLGDSHKNGSRHCQRLYVIDALRADGLLEEGLGDMSGTLYSPALFDELTSPTFPTPAEPHMKDLFPSVGSGDDTAAPLQDGMHPQFIEFVRALRTSGWELDVLLIQNKGYTTVVNYL
ncbi:hypothetical protein LSCM4_05886 [Leishmania orientalis]|uniref:Protein root UVB sensitive/RUS domain-containing protein n=1 Tax=Leishmania orientalis TaxID=2249476 RepID=A0A836HNK8_9TRYP|nr:hypothetical protein LSCM4_05886 [Leishmania orientalis]